MRRALQNLRGVAAVLCMIFITLAFFLPLLPASIVKLAVARPVVRRPAGAAVMWVAMTWARFINSVILGFSGTRVDYDQQVPDDRDGRYLLISNHQCWADVMLLVYLLESRLPFPRFFIKEQLRWLPVVGLACWALDYPFMRRHSRAELEANPALRTEDMNTVRRACAVFREVPVTIINYAEGTRSTAAKRAAVGSPYAALLPPKAGGTAFALNAMHDVLEGVLDMSVAYVNTPEPRFWDVLCGRIAHVAIRLRALDVPYELFAGDYMADPAYRARFKDWLETVWAEKDAEVATIQNPQSHSIRFASAPPAAREPRATP